MRIKNLEDYIAKEDALRQREKDLWQQKVDLEKEKTSLAEKELALQKDQTQFYKAAFEAVTKRRGIGCKILRVFTFGRHKCK